MSSSPSKGTITPAFRYFVFILCLCIFLFGFLVMRLTIDFDPREEFNQPVQQAQLMLAAEKSPPPSSAGE